MSQVTAKRKLNKHAKSLAKRADEVKDNYSILFDADTLFKEREKIKGMKLEILTLITDSKQKQKINSSFESIEKKFIDLDFHLHLKIPKDFGDRVYELSELFRTLSELIKNTVALVMIVYPYLWEFP